MNQENLLTKLTLAIITTILSSNLYAAGFQLKEHSAAGLGRAFAGEGAMNDTAAAAGRNPAAMMMFDQPTISVGGTYVSPKIDIKGTSPMGKSLEAGDIAPSAFIPNAHYVHPINNKFALGTSLTSNYGLSTKYAKDYPAGMLAGMTKLTTANLNLNSAYRLNQNFSVGAGFNIVYAKAKLIRHLGEAADVTPLPRDTEIAYLKGDKWGYGWNLGLLYELNNDNHFALSYRSKVKIDFKGDFHNQLPVNMGGTDGVTIPGKLSLKLPDIWELSAYHRVAPQWAVHYSVAYTGWNSFKELVGTGEDGKQLFYKEEGFKNNIFVSIGSTYDYNKDWTFRAGLAYDKSAAPSNHRSISIPDQNRYWITTGTTYHLSSDASVDIGVAYMRGKQVNFTEKVPTGGDYKFNAKGSALLFGINTNYSF